MLSPVRRILKAFHPEGIPRPGALFYNALGKTRIFQASYEFLSKDILAANPEGRILDIGTGPAFLLIKIARMRPGLRLTGLDISPAMVSTAERNIDQAGLSATIDAVAGSATRLPFPDASFDMVVSTGSIHHWKDPVAGLNEAYRVLKTNGRAFLYDLVTDMPKSTLREFNREFGLLRTTLLWLHTFTEPFHSSNELELLARSSLFGHGRTRFAGMFCCLELRKQLITGSLNPA